MYQPIASTVANELRVMADPQSINGHLQALTLTVSGVRVHALPDPCKALTVRHDGGLPCRQGSGTATRSAAEHSPACDSLPRQRRASDVRNPPRTPGVCGPAEDRQAACEVLRGLPLCNHSTERVRGGRTIHHPLEQVQVVCTVSSTALGPFRWALWSEDRRGARQQHTVPVRCHLFVRSRLA